MDGYIGVNTFVWAEELSGGWCKMKDVPELHDVYGAPAPKHRKKKSIASTEIVTLEKAKHILKLERPQYLKRHASMDQINLGNTADLMAKWGK